jgi:UDP-2-acetamido-3-amino-2,3-dideoxy-glucuronate N-acetyltransferase
MATIIYQPTVNRAKSIGEGTKIGAFCDLGSDVIIGKNCNIQSHVILSNGTIVGDNVFIAPNVTILNDKYMDGRVTPVTIGNEVKIGGSCVLLPNVKIGNNAFVGAGSVVTKDVPPGKAVVGNPARIIGDVSDF